MFAGTAASNEIRGHLNGIGNAMNVEMNAHTRYDGLQWGIEAKGEGGQVRFGYHHFISWSSPVF